MSITESQLRAGFLQQRQSLPIGIKIQMAQRRIRQWYEAHDGRVYVAFSGGIDSTILLDLVRALYPGVPAVFVDTGLEFPEVREFVRSVGNVTWLKPQHSFKEITQKYGYPVVSKEVSMSISRYRNTTSDVQRELRLHGGINPTSGRMQSVGVIPEKYKYLIYAPFKISETCCYYLKKKPLKDYEKQSGRMPFIGVMAADSRARARSYAKYGCNSFNGLVQSRPMSFWTKEDILTLTPTVNHSKIYEMGYDRTGCMFCGFGIQQEGTPNRWQKMQLTHPRIHRLALPALGIDTVMNFMGVPCNI